MHRKNPVKIRVQAPSRGLVTRWPTNTADQRNPQDRRRAFVRAENVRFEDGIVASAPGSERALLTGGVLTNLLSHWRFDESPGATYYDSHGSVNLTIDDAFLGTVAGKFSNAAYFNLPPLDKLLNNAPGWTLANNSLTVCGWVKMLTGSFAAIISSDVFTVDIQGNNLHIGVGIEGVYSSVSLAANTWYFFCAQLVLGSPNVVKIRVNNTVDQANITGHITANPTYIQMGDTGLLSSQTWAQDSISVWNRALSSGEIDSIYNSGTGLDYPFISGNWTSLYQANLIATPPDPVFFGSAGKLFLGNRTFQSLPRQYQLTLTEVYPGASGSALANATMEYRWSFSDFLNKAIAVQKDIVPQYYLSGDTRDVPGLPTGNKYDGTETFFNHVLLWKDQTLKWSDLEDFTCWIPVASTISNLSLTLSSNITQSAAGGQPTVSGDPWLPVTEVPVGLTVGQFVRIDDTQSSLPYYNFYTVAAVSPIGNLSATSVTGSQTVGASTTSIVFLTSQTDWAVGQRVVVAGNSTVLTVASASTLKESFSSLKTNATPSSSFDVIIAETNSGWEVGDYVSLGSSLTPGQDIFLITAVKSNASTGETTLTLSDQTLGSGAALTSYAAGTLIIRQPWVKLTNPTGSPITVATASAITERYAVKLTLQDLTGRTAAAATILAGKKIVTLLANEAGEASIIGGEDNGPILKVVKMGEYARIFKNRSISVLQYVGAGSGTFFVRNEIVNEGLISREAIVKLNDSRVVMLGNRELYNFQGGLSLTPVCTQYTRTLFDELDRGRVNEVVLHHREQRNEVWVVYPVLGSGFKVLIWNYVEDTASIDIYNASTLILRSAGQLDWLTDPAWVNLAQDLSWDRVDPTSSWNSYVGSGVERVTALLAADGSVSIHGAVYNRNGLAYTSLAETIDEDFGDESIFKYVDSLQLSIYVKVPDSTPRKLYVQVGSRSDLDSDITWTIPVYVSVSGSGNVMTKVNPGGAGRFLRLRFYSQDADVQWRISSWVFCVRPGSSY